MLHVPSLFVGSLTSGSAFLLVHQQLSYRESLSRKWAMAEKAETELRAQMKKLKAHVKDHEFVADANDNSFSTKTVSKYYKKILDDAQTFFGKKD
eukprot:jgi/Psemu1/307062/fgenesh1_kg.300_\